MKILTKNDFYVKQMKNRNDNEMSSTRGELVILIFL